MRPTELALYSQIPENRDLFAMKTIGYASKLQVDPDDLMTVMYFESKLNPQAKNPNSTASGLIQFTEATAKALGTTTTHLRTLNNVAQLDYVYLYLKPFTGKMSNLTEAYCAVFYPAALGRSDSYSLNMSQDSVAANKIFDLSQNGIITKAEISRSLQDYANYLKKKYPNYQPDHCAWV